MEEVKFMKKIVLLMLVIISTFLVACSNSNECQADKDCVAASCCHASEAVPKGEGPDCTGQLCTMECVSGTIDCNQGKIKCLSGECQVVLN